MGLSRSVYLGPHLICRYIVKAVERQVASCTHPGCRRFGLIVRDDKFCYVCGHAMQMAVETDWVPAVDVVDLRLKVNEALFVPDGFDTSKDNSHVWLSNRHIDGRSFDIDTDVDTSHLLIDEAMISGENELFKRHHEADIKTICAAYGEENVIARWGLVTWVS